jgi:hypothetical protein
LSAGSLLALLWRAPLSALSFAFFRLNRFLLTSLRRAHFRRRQSPEWLTLPELLARPLALPIVMVTGPRWNTHALVATAGPVRVERSLRLDASAADASARLWTVVVYSAARTETVAAVDSRAPRGEGAGTVELPPGAYSLVLRYYEWAADPRLPSVAIDGRPAIPERSLPGAGNDYLRALGGQRRGYGRALHYYVLNLLRYRRLFPASFVRAEFLPVGNPETEFAYGALERGQTLEIDCPPALLAAHRVYVTVYDSASFPVTWRALDAPGRTALEATAAGYYLLRLHRLPGQAAVPNPADALTVRTVRTR